MSSGRVYQTGFDSSYYFKLYTNDCQPGITGQFASTDGSGTPQFTFGFHEPSLGEDQNASDNWIDLQSIRIAKCVTKSLSGTCKLGGTWSDIKQAKKGNLVIYIQIT